MRMSNPITIETRISNITVEKAWELFTGPQHIKEWNHASADWGVGAVSNDVQAGGRFAVEMKALDGSASFVFSGVYNEVTPMSFVATMDDGRFWEVSMVADNDDVHVIESFQPEKENPEDMQRAGWQAILDTFKAYAEAHQQSVYTP